MTAIAETPVDELRAQVHDAARAARTAAGVLALANRDTKDAVLLAMADALRARSAEILAANERDIATGRDAGMPDAIADGLRTVAALPDPVGEVLRGSLLPNGLEVRQVRVPLGVVGMVYEGRPNVTVDAAGLALKSGNAVLLRGSSSAEQSNTALVAVLRDTLAAQGLPR